VEDRQQAQARWEAWEEERRKFRKQMAELSDSMGAGGSKCGVRAQRSSLFEPAKSLWSSIGRRDYGVGELRAVLNRVAKRQGSPAETRSNYQKKTRCTFPRFVKKLRPDQYQSRCAIGFRDRIFCRGTIWPASSSFPSLHAQSRLQAGAPDACALVTRAKRERSADFSPLQRSNGQGLNRSPR
jgi:hypothetical protein